MNSLFLAPEDCEKFNLCGPRNGTKNDMENDLAMLTSSIIVVGSIVFVIIIIKSSWKKIHMWLLPPIPEPIIVIHETERDEPDVEETRLLSVENETRSSRTEACLRVSSDFEKDETGLSRDRMFG